MYHHGGILHRHNDTIVDPFSVKKRKGVWQPRLLTICIYLNKDYKEEYGGNLVIYDKT